MASDHYCFDVQGVVGDGVCDGTEILVRYIRYRVLLPENTPQYPSADW